jgi:hypothetical protein
VAAPGWRAAGPAGQQTADPSILLTGAVVWPGGDPTAPHPTLGQHQKTSGTMPEVFLSFPHADFPTA